MGTYNIHATFNIVDIPEIYRLEGHIKSDGSGREVFTPNTSYDANDGIFSDQTSSFEHIVYRGARVTDYPQYEEPTRDGYKFMGWINALTGEVWNVDLDYIPTGKRNSYAVKLQTI